MDGGYLTSARSGENVARAVFQTAAHAVGVDRPSGIDGPCVFAMIIERTLAVQRRKKSSKPVLAEFGRRPQVDLTSHELAFHDRALGVGVVASDAAAGGRTADADRIEAEDRALEDAKRRGGGCACAVS